MRALQLANNTDMSLAITPDVPLTGNHKYNKSAEHNNVPIQK